MGCRGLGGLDTIEAFSILGRFLREDGRDNGMMGFGSQWFLFFGNYWKLQQQTFVCGFVNLHIVFLCLSSTVQCINELLVSVAPRFQKHWKWLLNSIVSHTVAIDWAILSFLVSKPVLLRGRQG